jgi:hypothetical protein
VFGILGAAAIYGGTGYLAWQKGKSVWLAVFMSMATGGLALLYYAFCQPEWNAPGKIAERQVREAANKVRDEEFRKRAEDIATQRREHESKLLAKGDLIPAPTKEFVRCSNNHRYRYEDFGWGEVEYYTEQHPTWYSEEQQGWVGGNTVQSSHYQVFGCPLCKSRSWSFENPDLSGKYRKGKCGHWYSRRFENCPLCDAKFEPREHSLRSSSSSGSGWD